jgi:hypothetical protein
MNYIKKLEKYENIEHDNILYVICRNRYKVILNTLLTCKDPIKKLKYKSILDEYAVLINAFLDIELQGEHYEV